jgi:cytidyltransferase-like protein
MRKILIMGLPGAGKTTLATALAPLINAVVFNADAVRANLSRDLGFSHADRIEHARRMGWMCDRVVEAGGTVIADFICPTEERAPLSATPSPSGSIVSRPAASRTPTGCSSRPDASTFASVPKAHRNTGPSRRWPGCVRHSIRRSRRHCFLGRYQPFHPGHQRLIEEGLRRVGQVCIAVRDTHGIDEKNPLPFFAVKQRIEAALSAHAGRFVVVPLPNITNVFYGRDVGYTVERIVLDETTEAISATQVRRLRTAP